MNFKFLLLSISLLLVVGLTSNSYAQMSVYGMPKSQEFGLTKNNASAISLKKPNVDQLLTEDELLGSNRFGKVLPFDAEVQKIATWEVLPNGDKICRTTIKSAGAKGLSIYFDDFYLADGAELYIYNKDYSQVLGAYTSINNKSNGAFAVGILYGEEAIIEYYAPANLKESSRLNIEGIGYAYRNVNNYLTKDFGDSESCQVNVNCSEGSNATEQRDAVVRILVLDDGDQGWCTGTMINNERQDCTPYLLTAEHCGQTSTTSDFTQWIFYFNYQGPGCSNPASEGTLGNQSLTGCTLKAQSNDNGGDTGSDFFLLELSSTIPSSYNVFYAGWNRANTASPSGYGIHHPSGDIKKISTYTSSLTSTSYSGTVANTHWAVQWVSTANGHGVTEGGSSGSALFDNNGRIVGSLTGGASFCNAPNDEDEYGKFSFSWDQNGNAANRRLKDWLDPDATGIMTLDGVYQPCLTSTEQPLDVNAFKVFPNPASDLINIEFEKAIDEGQLYISNAIGQVVYSEELNNVDRQAIAINGWSQGMYMITVVSNGQAVTSKVIVNQ